MLHGFLHRELLPYFICNSRGRLVLIAGPGLMTALLVLLSLSATEAARSQTSITVNATQRRGIGGISTLDRTRFFNHHGTLAPPSSTNLGNLASQLGSATGLNSSPGRTSTEFDQFISNSLSQDPARPGFINPTQLRTFLQSNYRDFVTTGSRYQTLRENPNALLINSGRSADFWPAFMRTDPNTNITNNYFPNKAAYAEFLNIYLDEVVYGPNKFMPVQANRFHIELVNEPDFHTTATFTPQNLAEYHRDIAQLIHAQHPDASVGGASLGATNFAENNFARFDQFVKPLIATAGADLDFYSMHPYERYNVQTNGSWSRQIAQSPGRVTAMIDLVQNQHEIIHGDRKQIAFTEYGSFNQPATINGNPSMGNYPRDLQQWDLVRDVRDKMMVFLNRPDTVLNATPFISPRDYRPDIPTSVLGDNVFWEQDANGNWSETIVASLFRSYAPIKGEYIGISGDNKNIQQVAFRDGNKVFVVLNNMLTSSQALNLQLIAGQFGTVSSATIDRLYRAGNINSFVDDLNITNGYQNLVLNSEEGAVITFTIASASGFLTTTNERTFYGDQVITELNVPTGKSPVIGIDADLKDALSALLRVNFSRPSNLAEAFDILINGNVLSMTAGSLGIDDGDFAWFSREISVPLNFLINGTNNVQVDFSGNGGYLSSAALMVTVAIPEPGSFAGLLAAGLYAVVRRRRSIG